MKGKKSIALVLALFVVLCAGCAKVQVETEKGNTHHSVVPMEGTPIVDYMIPSQSANVLVDRLGYQTDSEKEAAVKGKRLPEEFRVVDADSGEVVYTGSIKKVDYNTELDLYTGRAVFDEVTRPGMYYVECDIIGRSYPFAIMEDLYEDLFDEARQEMLARCGEGTMSLSDGVVLLTAYEWYPQIFSDDEEEEIPDVLAGLSGWIEQYEEEEELNDPVLYAAFLAKFSYLYQNYDRNYATACMQRASNLLGQAQSSISKDSVFFFALTEAYRATGLATYRKQILDYKSFFENNTSFLEEPEYLFGTMTYLTTRQKVDMSLCDIFMQTLMDRGEEIASRYEEIVHPVTAHNNGTEDVLRRGGELLFANYVLESYQYYNINKDFLHYLGGRNLESICFYRDEENHDSYILLLAQLAANSHKEGAQ